MKSTDWHFEDELIFKLRRHTWYLKRNRFLTADIIIFRFNLKIITSHPHRSWVILLNISKTNLWALFGHCPDSGNVTFLVRTFSSFSWLLGLSCRKTSLVVEYTTIDAHRGILGCGLNNTYHGTSYCWRRPITLLQTCSQKDKDPVVTGSARHHQVKQRIAGIASRETAPLINW